MCWRSPATSSPDCPERRPPAASDRPCCGPNTAVFTNTMTPTVARRARWLALCARPPATGYRTWRRSPADLSTHILGVAATDRSARPPSSPGPASAGRICLQGPHRTFRAGGASSDVRRQGVSCRCRADDESPSPVGDDRTHRLGPVGPVHRWGLGGGILDLIGAVLRLQDRNGRRRTASGRPGWCEDGYEVDGQGDVAASPAWRELDRPMRTSRPSCSFIIAMRPRPSMSWMRPLRAANL